MKTIKVRTSLDRTCSGTDPFLFSFLYLLSCSASSESEVKSNSYSSRVSAILAGQLPMAFSLETRSMAYLMSSAVRVDNGKSLT